MAAEDFQRLERLQAFVSWVTEGLGRRERVEALCLYLRGLLLAGERKSIQPVAERIAGDVAQTEAFRQRLQQAVVVAKWDEGIVFERIANAFLSRVPDCDAVVIDDTGFAKKGTWSPGVQRQYSGTLGRVDNCQVAVSLHLATPISGACIGMQLFLPESWEEDLGRRRKCGIPDEVHHTEKWRMALAMLDRRQTWGIHGKLVLADAGYGDAYDFRAGLTEKGHPYIVGISLNTTLWADGNLPLSPEERADEYRGVGRKISRWEIDATPDTALALARRASPKAWRILQWTNGMGEPRSGRFLMQRVRVAHRASHGNPPGDEQWLIVQWDGISDEPSNYWLSTLPPDTKPDRLAYLAKLRWRIERDYQEMKGELGLDHFEGRTWAGFHHHCALVAAAHAFLALERALFPPQRPDATALPPAPSNSAAPGNWTLPALSTPVHSRRRRACAT